MIRTNNAACLTSITFVHAMDKANSLRLGTSMTSTTSADGVIMTKKRACLSGTTSVDAVSRDGIPDWVRSGMTSMPSVDAVIMTKNVACLASITSVDAADRTKIHHWMLPAWPARHLPMS